MKLKGGSLEEIQKIDKCLAKLTKRKREKTESNTIRDKKREESTRNTKEIQIIIKIYFMIQTPKGCNLVITHNLVVTNSSLIGFKAHSIGQKSLLVLES